MGYLLVFLRYLRQKKNKPFLSTSRRRPLVSWFLRAGQVVCRIHECDVRERLRKIANQASRVRVVLLGQQPDIIPECKQPLEQLARIVAPPGEDVRIREPEAAGEERALALGQPVVARARVVPKKEPVDEQPPFDCLDRA